MRRWLALLLLVLLPLQFGWAAVADYCSHALGTEQGHLGHHDHAVHGHAPVADDAGDAGSGNDAAATHVDCGHCHGHWFGVLALATALVPQAPADAPPALGPAPPADHAPAQPERPQWRRLA